MNIIFFGNTKYSLIGAQIIHEQIGLAAIVTIPDRPDKRGRLRPSPLKTFAETNKIPVITANKLDDATIQRIADCNPDFFVVEDYGLILPKRLLDMPKKAALNIHHSLLPKYRGSSPAPAALLAGDQTTGVTVINMTEKLDAGDILAQKAYTIKPDDTTDSLLTILNKLGGELIVPILKDFEAAQTKAIKQDESQATHTKKLTKEDGYININSLEIGNWKLEIARKIRAYYPWPTVWTLLRLPATAGQAKEKRVIFLPNKMLQVEGKKPMNIKDFLNGYPETQKIITKLLYE